MNFIKWLFRIPTKEEEIREEEERAKKIKVSEAFNKIMYAKTLDELELIRQSMGDACIDFGFGLFAKATTIRLNDLEERVNKLEMKEKEK